MLHRAAATRAEWIAPGAPARPSPTAKNDMSDNASTLAPARDRVRSVGVVGAGRLGTALAAALVEVGYAVVGPVGRGEVPGAEAILLCVPDGEIPAAARAVAGAASFVGHTSGATGVSALGGVRAQALGPHPLQTFARESAGRSALERFAGAGCAVAGSTLEALEVARRLARDLGMAPFEIVDRDRAAYHAAASVASNFLVTLQAAAEELAAAAGLPPPSARALLAPLVRRSVDNWAALGPERALTGPLARGDDQTVARQRAAVAEAAPALVPLFDDLVERTRALAARAVAA
jgi:predicted short-subunit dehydrogenase-like oxidoreductase (DUF2520 family)